MTTMRGDQMPKDKLYDPVTNAQCAIRYMAYVREREARRLVEESLPRRLRWLVGHPRGLRMLKRLRLWRPPVMVEDRPG
jgi:hypothetical protein